MSKLNPRSRRSSLESSQKIEFNQPTLAINNEKQQYYRNMSFFIPNLILPTKSIIVSADSEENELLLDAESNSEICLIEYKPKPKPPGSCYWKYAGILFCLLSSFTMSLSALIVKLLHEYHPFTLTIWRYVGNIVPSIPLLIYYIYWKEENIFSPIWPIIGQKHKQERRNLTGLLARGIFGGAFTILRFCALTYLSLADVSVITRTPALVIVLAYFCLDEKCNAVSTISAVLSIFGVFILSRPPILTGLDFDSNTLTGLGFSALALVSTSISMIITRQLRKVNFALLIFAFGIIGILEGGILSWSTGTFKFPQGPRDIFLTLLFTILTFIGQVFAVLAVKFEGAGPVAVVRTSYVLFAFVWQIIFLRLYPDLISLVGALIVFIGIVLTAMRKSINKSKKNKLEKKISDSERSVKSLGVGEDD